MTKSNIFNILEDYFLYVGRSDIKTTSSTVNAIIEIHNSIEKSITVNLVSKINLNDSNEINRKIDENIASLCSLNDNIKKIKQSISYFLSEITDNMQQHADTDFGYIYTKHNDIDNQIEIILADGGMSIYGSYIKANKFIENIENSDILAVGIAKDGYSTKDRPEAENRGYGLSSNIKMINKGLNGDFAIMSGNALYISSIDKLIELPEQLDWKGTLVLAIIPTDIPSTFSFYDYIK
jgi:low affinity Fe/Cu permease